jgi:hypothetical protein
VTAQGLQVSEFFFSLGDKSFRMHRGSRQQRQSLLLYDGLKGTRKLKLALASRDLINVHDSTLVHHTNNSKLVKFSSLPIIGPNYLHTLIGGFHCYFIEQIGSKYI